MQKYFHVQSNLRLNRVEYFHEKTLHVEGNKIPKANLKYNCRFIRLLNLETVGVMSRTSIDCGTPFYSPMLGCVKVWVKNWMKLTGIKNLVYMLFSYLP